MTESETSDSTENSPKPISTTKQYLNNPRLIGAGTLILIALCFTGYKLVDSQSSRNSQKEQISNASPNESADTKISPQQCQDKLNEAKTLIKSSLPDDPEGKIQYSISDCVDLNLDKKPEMIVKAESQPVLGKHAYYYIITIDTNGSLSSVPTGEDINLWVDKISVLPNSHNKWSDIQLTSSINLDNTETQTLAWSGSAYVDIDQVNNKSANASGNQSYTTEMFVGAENVNIRKEPSINSPVLLKASLNMPVKVVDTIQKNDGYTWRMLNTPDGQTGWAVNDMLTSEKRLTGSISPEQGILFSDGRSIKIGQNLQEVIHQFGEPSEKTQLDNSKIKYQFKILDSISVPVLSVIFFDNKADVIQFGAVATSEAIQALKYIKTKEGVGLGTSFSELSRIYGLFEVSAQGVQKSDSPEKKLKDAFYKVLIGNYMNNKSMGFSILDPQKTKDETMNQLFGISVFSENMRTSLMLEQSGVADAMREDIQNDSNQIEHP